MAQNPDQRMSAFVFNSRGRGQLIPLQPSSSPPRINYSYWSAAGRGNGLIQPQRNLPMAPTPLVPTMNPPKPQVEVDTVSNASPKPTKPQRYWNKDREDLRIAVIKNETRKQFETWHYRHVAGQSERQGQPGPARR